MSPRPLAVTAAAILLGLLSLYNFPWPQELLFPGTEEPTGFCHLLGLCGGRCGPRSHRRIVDA
jgi:hypothetical protein